ncbi:MAG: tetratricopeptide repeat protein [Parvibaculaceae bacterium]
MMRLQKLILLSALLLAGCGTYYDPADNYVRGLRWFDRGDYVAAAELWKPMAEAGDCDAQYRYGHLLWLGLGVETNKAVAQSMWKKAADGGQAKAQIAMGNLAFAAPDNIYQCHEGCSSDAGVAYKWYLLADKNAHYEGERKSVSRLLADIRDKLSVEARAKSERIANEWTPVPKACNPRDLL